MSAYQLFSGPFTASLQHVAMLPFARIRVFVPTVLAIQQATAWSFLPYSVWLPTFCRKLLSGAVLTIALLTETISYQFISYLLSVGRPYETLPLTHAYISFAPAAQLLMCMADMAVQFSNRIRSPSPNS